MTIAIRNLQLIYGVAGAREAFEQLCSILIKNEYPDARAVRVFNGDGGVDNSVGAWDGQSPVTVFQQKFFIEGVGESQRGQIRASYRVAAQNPAFTLERWVLCLPLSLSADERKWFDNWVAKQDHPIELWDELKLQQLLLEEKNRQVKEQFFREEHLSQIRDIHTIIIDIADNIARGKNARRQKDHDVVLFQQLTRDMLGRRLLDLCDFMFRELHLAEADRTYLREYMRWAEDPSNDFLLPSLNEERRKFDQQFRELLAFIGANYFPSKVAGDRSIYFQPGARHDPDRQRYFRGQLDKLDELLGATRTQYQSFVRDAQRILHEHDLI